MLYEMYYPRFQEELIKEKHFDEYFDPVELLSADIPWVTGDQRVHTAQIEWSGEIGYKSKGSALLTFERRLMAATPTGYKIFDWTEWGSLLEATLSFSFMFTNLDVPKEARRNPLFSITPTGTAEKPTAPLEFFWNCEDNTLEIKMTDPVDYTLYKEKAVGRWYTIDVQMEPVNKIIRSVYVNGVPLEWPPGYDSAPLGPLRVELARWGGVSLYGHYRESMDISAIQLAFDDFELRTGFWMTPPSPPTVPVSTFLWLLLLTAGTMGLIYIGTRK